jgi:hypothetical protein
VIILHVHIDGIFTIKFKSNAPISGYRHSIGAFAATAQAMKLEAGDIHIVRSYDSIQPVEYPFDSGLTPGDDASVVSFLEEPLKAFVSEVSNHVSL